MKFSRRKHSVFLLFFIYTYERKCELISTPHIAFTGDPSTVISARRAIPSPTLQLREIRFSLFQTCDLTGLIFAAHFFLSPLCLRRLEGFAMRGVVVVGGVFLVLACEFVCVYVWLNFINQFFFNNGRS